MRRLSCVGMSASPPTSDVWLRRRELTPKSDDREVVIRRWRLRKSFPVGPKLYRGARGRLCSV
jgi:hypothetical protein